MRRYAKYLVAGFVLLISVWLILLRAQFAGVAINHWTPTADMAFARAAACSALLPDGRVLVAGGYSSSGVVNTAELYGSNGTFVLAAPMAQARAGAACAAMQDGRVLVTGGSDGASALASAEIYDPAADTWTSAGAMSVARSGHTATLLPWGSVLIVGGDSNGAATNSVELYLLNGLFQTGGTLSSPRKDYAIAVMPNHQVIIAGGSDGSTALNTIDLFDADKFTVTPAGTMLVARTNFAAAPLLDGTVLITGGLGANGNVLASSEIYDPVKQVSADGPQLPVSRANHQAYTLPNNGRVILVGGNTDNSQVLTATHVYSPWTGKFASTAPMNAARSGDTAALLRRGSLIVAGGKNAGGYLTSGEIYGFATVETDKNDYPPGTPVIMTGSGWKPGEQVLIQVTAFPLDKHNIEFTGAAVADGTGQIKLTGFQADKSHLGMRFLLNASGSESQAQTLFSDGDSTAMTLAAETPGIGSPSYPSGITFTLQVQDTVGGGGAGAPAGGTITTTDNGGPGPTSTDVGVGTAPFSENYSVSFNASSFYLTPGPHSILFVYHDAATWNDCQMVVNYTINPVNTAITPSGGGSIYYGVTPGAANLLATVAVTGSTYTGNPSGTVTFADGQGNSYTCTLAAGGGGTSSCSYTTPSTLSAGTHNFIATYSGFGSIYNGISAGSPIVVTVNPDTTTTAVSPSPGSSQPYGTPITFTATVANGVGASSAVPAGYVTFFDNGALLGSPSIPLNGSAQAAIVISTLSVGTHSNITATYVPSSPPANFAGSSSPAITYVITGDNTTTTITDPVHGASPYTGLFGTPMQFQVTVTNNSTAIAPIGTITLKDTGAAGAPIVGTGTLNVPAGNTNQVTITVSNLPCTGCTIAPNYFVHNIRAFYTPGNPDFLVSDTSTTVDYVYQMYRAMFTEYGGDTSPLTVSVSPSTMTMGTTFTVTVNGASAELGGVMPTGGVVIYFNGVNSTNQIASLGSSGTASVTYTAAVVAGWLNAGANIISVTYNGDDNYFGYGHYESLTPTGYYTTLTVSLATATPLVYSTPSSGITYGNPIVYKLSLTSNMSGALGPVGGTAQFFDSYYSATVVPGQIPGCSTGTSPTNQPVSGGLAVCQPTSPPPAGTHLINVTWSGDGNYAAGSWGTFGVSGYTVTVNPELTSVALTPSVTTTTLNGSVTYTAVVNGSPVTPPGTGGTTGHVDFQDIATSNYLCTNVLLVGGVYSCTKTYDGSSTELTAITHNVQAIYVAPTTGALAGDFAGSTSPAATVTVNKGNVTLDNVTSFNGTSLTYGATTYYLTVVTPNSPPSGYTGLVQFLDNGVPLGSVSICTGFHLPGGYTNCLTAGQAVYPAAGVLTPTAGTHNIRAQFLGDTNYNTAGPTPATAVVVAKASVSPTSGGSTYSVIYGGQLTTAQISVAAASGTALAPTGTLTLTAGPGLVQIGSPGTLSPGAVGNPSTYTFSGAQLPVTLAAAVGLQSLVITYSGDSNYLSNPLANTITVNQSIPAGVVTTTGTPSNYNAPVRFTLTLAPLQSQSGCGTLCVGVPTGSVIFYADGVALNASTPATITNGVASWTTTALTPGTGTLTNGVHDITAIYSGDTNFTAGPTFTLSGGQTITPASTTTTLQASNLTPSLNSTVIYTATVTSAYLTPNTGSGTVDFNDVTGASHNLCPDAPLSATGVATCSVPYDASDTYHIAGPHTIQAHYKSTTTNTWSSSYSAPVTISVALASVTLGQVASSATNGCTPPAYCFTYGTLTNLSVSLSPPNPSPGYTTSPSVQFLDNGVVIGTVAVVSAGGPPSSVATLANYNFLAGTHNVRAQFLGDSNYNAAGPTAALSITVNKAAPTLVWAASDPATAEFGRSFTTPLVSVAGVANGVNVTGTISLSSNGTAIGSPATLTGGTVTTPSSVTLPGGTVTVTATLPVSIQANPSQQALKYSYSGDSNYLPADTGTTDHILVGATAIPYAVTSSTISSYPVGHYPPYGQPIVLTATLAVLAGQNANSLDQVVFQEGATTVCGPVLKVTDNVFTCTAPSGTFAVGSHTIQIAFSNTTETNYTLAGTGLDTLLTFSVAAAPTTTTLTAYPVSALPGQSVTFTATVAVPLPGVATPVGTVSFTQDTIAGLVPIANGNPPPTYCSSVTVVAGVATCTVPPTISVPTPPWFVSPGAYGIHATFTPGDANTATSTGNLAYTVNKVQPGISLSTSVANNATYGLPITYTVEVDPPAGTTTLPTGQVTFYDGGVQLIGTTVQTLVPVVVGPNTYMRASVTVSNSSSNLLTVGTHAITAFYGGDSNYGSITSSVLNQIVVAAPTTTGGDPSGLNVNVTYDPTPANAPVYGQPITFTARVTAQYLTTVYNGKPSGTVTFTDGGTAIPGATATLVACTPVFPATDCNWSTVTFTLPSGSLPGLSTGSHAIGANYHGDGNFTASSTGSNYNSFTVHAAATTTTVTTPAPATSTATYGLPTYLLVARVTPFPTPLVSGTRVGTISFYDYSCTGSLDRVHNLLGTSGPVDASGSGSIQVPLVGSTPGFQTLGVSGTIVGPHCIVAEYNGASGTPADPNFATSTSGLTDKTLNITRAVTATTVQSSTGWASVYGQPVTFTATVTAASSVGLSPGATVTFVDGTLSISAPMPLTGSGNSVSGAQTFPVLNVTSALGVGSHSISANYAGDLNYLPSTGPGAAPQVVSKANTTTVVTSSCLSSSSGCTVGQQLTLTAVVTVNPPGNGAPLATNPTGTVLFYNGSTALQCSTSGALTQSTGIATCLLPTGLPQGSLALTAVYSGDPSFNTSTSAIVTQGINTIAVTVIVTATASPIVYGTSVTFYVTVAPIDTTFAGPKPTGTAVFYDGGAQLCNTTLSGGGQSQCTPAGPLAVGTHAISVQYTPTQDQTGHINFQPNASQTVPLIVSQIPNSLSLTASWTTGYAGQPITFTAQVQAQQAPGVPYATGTVSFFDGTYASTSNIIGIASLTSGVATLQPSINLAPGLHQILAVYQGDSFYVTSQSNFVAVNVNVATTTTMLTSSVNPSVVGQTVTFTVTVGVGYPSTFGPSGQVQLWDNSVALGSPQTANNGTITITVPGLMPGTHNIYATFLANNSFSTSSSNTLTQVVNKASTVTTLAALPVSSTSGQQVVLTAVVVVQAPGTGIPTGTVQFVDTTFNRILGTAPLNMIGGVYTATITTNQMVQSGAPQLLTATYSGDANFATSTSVPQGQTVFGSQITVTNAASYYSSNFSPDSWATAWGSNLANSTLAATTTPLPTSLAGSTVQVTDAAGVQRLAPLSFVSPGQINFMIPANTAAGLATVTVTNGFGATASTIIIISPTAPGLFSQDSSGTGLAAGQFIIVHANGTQDAPVAIAQYNAATGQWVPVPIAPAATDQVYLVLYGTGIRYRPSSGSVTATVNGQSVPVAYAGPQAQFAGEDQVNLGPLPSMAGAGTVPVRITVNGEPSNTVTVNFQ